MSDPNPVDPVDAQDEKERLRELGRRMAQQAADAALKVDWCNYCGVGGRDCGCDE